MKAQKANVISIDRTILEELKMNGASVKGVYTSTIHLSLNTCILTVGSKIGKGKHHIVIDQAVDFYEGNLIQGTPVNLNESMIHLGDIQLHISKDAIIDFKPYEKIYRHDQYSIQLRNQLKVHVKESQAYRSFINDQSHLLQRLMMDKVDVFMHSPGYPSALSILGLGMGLTPFGDDVLTGFILGLNTLGKHLPWIPDVVKDAIKKTSLLSAQNLSDTLDQLYPDLFVDLIEDFFVHHRFDAVNKVLSLGATSGLGIMLGFIQGIS